MPRHSPSPQPDNAADDAAAASHDILATGRGSPEDFAPIFIVGTPRSGTTLLATMLSRHSRIAAPPETRFMAEVVDDARDRAAMLARLAENRRCRDLGLDDEVIAAGFMAAPPTYDWLFRVLLETYAVEAGKDLVAEKSPIHLLHVPVLMRWYPAARFLLLARDGRDCVLSLLRAPWAHDSAVRHAAEWRRRMRWARRLLDGDARRLHVVRYEDLILEPERQLGRAMDFLGLAFESGQLRAATASTAVPVWEAAWKAKAADLPDASRVAAWKRETDPATLLAMESVMRGELTAWGYDLANRRRNLGAALAGAVFASKFFNLLQMLTRKLRHL